MGCKEDVLTASHSTHRRRHSGTPVVLNIDAMSFSLARPCPPTSPKTLTINDHGLRSIESQVAEFQLYDLRNEQQGPRPCSPPSIDPLQPLSHSPTSARTLEIAGVPVPRKPFEPINTNSGIQRATAPPRIDFTGTIKGWTTNSPPLSSPMIREQHVPPHYPFHPVNPRSSVSRSSSSSSGTLVDSPERKGSVLTLSPTMSRITANGTPMEVGPGQGNECYLGFRPHLPSRQSMGDIPSMSPLHRGSLFPPRPELPERHSSYRTVASELANPDLIDASTAPETGRIYAVKPLITKLQSQLSDALSTLHAPIRVVGILASSDSGCKMYASTLAKSSEKLGVKFELRPVEWEETDEQAGRIDKVKRVIRSVNDDREVDGLFLFLPIFDTETVSMAIPLCGSLPTFFVQDKALRDMIDPQRDIEGISATSLGYSSRHPNPLSVPHNSTSIQSLQLSLPDFHPFPCTPLAVAQILRELDVYDREMRVGSRLQGKSVTVINRCAGRDPGLDSKADHSLQFANGRQAFGVPVRQ